MRNFGEVDYAKTPKTLKDKDVVIIGLVPDVLVKKGTRASGHRELIEYCAHNGYICSNRPQGGEAVHAFSWRPGQQEVDYSLLRDWLDFCVDHNINHCNEYPSEPSLMSFKLIDCETFSIVSGSSINSYVASSYVWGKSRAEQFNSNSSNANTSQGIRAAPRVIQDAISLTLHLGLRFLWVDRFCIEQDAHDAKQEQISSMDKIYANSTFIIVAAAGIDDTCGLPGLETTPRNIQPCYRAHDLFLTLTLPHPRKAIQRSKWSARGWTYQESILSRRSYVFTEDQVYFECRYMHACEAWEMPNALLHNQKLRNFKAFVHPGLFAGGLAAGRGRPIRPNTRFGNIMTHIEKFSQRELTWGTDTLNAMAGIFHSFETREGSVHRFWGMPIILDWQDPCSSVEDTLSRFAQVLLWSHDTDNTKRTPRRIAGIPNWTWAGWVGAVEFPIKETNSRSSDKCDVRLESNEGESIRTMSSIHKFMPDPKDGGSIYDLTPALKPFIFLKAYVLPPDVWASGITLAADSTSSVQSTELFPRAFSIAFRPELTTNRADVWFHLKLSKALERSSQIFTTLFNEEWSCLLIGSNLNGTHVLLVEWKEDRQSVEKVGVGVAPHIGADELQNLVSMNRHEIKLI